MVNYSFHFLTCGRYHIIIVLKVFVIQQFKAIIQHSTAYNVGALHVRNLKMF